MSQLTDKEIRQLGELGREIIEGLSCDIMTWEDSHAGHIDLLL